MTRDQLLALFDEAGNIGLFAQFAADVRDARVAAAKLREVVTALPADCGAWHVLTDDLLAMADLIEELLAETR